jgi:hypothetical protein
MESALLFGFVGSDDIANKKQLLVLLRGRQLEIRHH